MINPCVETTQDPAHPGFCCCPFVQEDNSGAALTRIYSLILIIIRDPGENRRQGEEEGEKV